MRSRLLRSLILVALVALASSCLVSPQPSPPFEPELAGERIGLTEAIELTGDLIGFSAPPGTVAPGGGEVLVTNLDDSLSPSVARVASDGSFTIAVPGHPGQRFRFQARNEGQRSEPYDVQVDANATIVTDLAAASSCLTIDPERWLDFDAVGIAHSLVITNACSKTVTIDPPRLRRGRAGFTFSPTNAISLKTDEVATITVIAKSATETEDVLYLEVTAPNPELRAVTLTLPDP